MVIKTNHHDQESQDLDSVQFRADSQGNSVLAITFRWIFSQSSRTTFERQPPQPKKSKTKSHDQIVTANRPLSHVKISPPALPNLSTASAKGTLERTRFCLIRSRDSVERNFFWGARNSRMHRGWEMATHVWYYLKIHAFLQSCLVYFPEVTRWSYIEERVQPAFTFAF